MVKRIAHNKISKEDVLADVKKVYDEKPADAKFKMDYYLAHGKYSKAPFKRLGGWNVIMEELGIPLNLHRNATREEMLDDIHRLRNEFGKVTATIQRKHGKYSQKVTDEMFGSFTAMMLAAGYIPSDIAKSKSNEEILEYLSWLYEQHGFLNSGIINAFSDISFVTILNRFGNMAKVYELLKINPQKQSNLKLFRANYVIGVIANELKEDPIYEWSSDWLLNPEKNNRLFVDGYFVKNKLAVEYDGEQHFKYIPFLHGHDKDKFKRQQTLDRHKTKLLEDNGIKVIRFKYNDPLTIENIMHKLHKKLA